VPFEAITGFFDPAVQFGFQFDTSEAAPAGAVAPPAKTPEKPAKPTTRPPAETKKADALPAPDTKEETPNAGGGEVVNLDRFRKK
jgi:uncharacterized protein